jgi:hypothetical protein
MFNFRPTRIPVTPQICLAMRLRLVRTRFLLDNTKGRDGVYSIYCRPLLLGHIGFRTVRVTRCQRQQYGVAKMDFFDEWLRVIKGEERKHLNRGFMAHNLEQTILLLGRTLAIRGFPPAVHFLEPSESSSVATFGPTLFYPDTEKSPLAQN